MEIIDSFIRWTRTGKQKRIAIASVRSSKGRQRFSVIWNDHEVRFDSLEACYAYCFGRGWCINPERYKVALRDMITSAAEADTFDLDRLDLSIDDDTGRDS